VDDIANDSNTSSHHCRPHSNQTQNNQNAGAGTVRGARPRKHLDLLDVEHDPPIGDSAIWIVTFRRAGDDHTTDAQQWQANGKR
jgi:hypothetical protein